MMIVVTGASASGKSAFAERRLAELEAEKKIYAATMIAWDEECRARIRKHRNMRRDKGFETEECPLDLHTAKIPEGSAVLLECMSNLAANELYREDMDKDLPVKERCLRSCDRIMDGILKVREKAGDLVVVTNEIFEDTGGYGEETEQYRRLLGRINRELFSSAGEVYRVVCGLPIRLKGDREYLGKNKKNEETEQCRKHEKNVGRKGEEGIHMRLIIGGAYQGKEKFGRELLAVSDMGNSSFDGGAADGERDSLEDAFRTKLILNFHLYVKRFADPADGCANEKMKEFIRKLFEKNPDAVITMDEIGCGIVPVDKRDRLWRDLSGEAAQILAGKAKEVYLVTGGIARPLKGEKS